MNPDQQQLQLWAPEPAPPRREYPPANPGGTVVGCVWGAWRALHDRLTDQGYPPDEIPSYLWCEHHWTSRLRRKAPAPAALPQWLEMELWATWRTERAQARTTNTTAVP